MEYRKVTGGQGITWFKQGWDIFMQAPLIIFSQFLLIFVAFAVLRFIPLLGALAATLLGFVLYGGVLLTLRHLESTRQANFELLFEGFKQHFKDLAILGLISAAIFIVFGLFYGMLISAGMVSAFGMGGMMGGMMSGGAVMSAMWATMTAAFIGLIIMLLIMIPVSMAFFFAAPLVVFNGMDAMGALKTSFHAFLGNTPAFLVYGLVYLVLAFFATLLFGLGWLVLGPVIMTSVYAAYKDVFSHTPSQTPPTVLSESI